jgi:hypothetical protein
MIFAPRGIYRHTATLTFSKRIKLVGEGTHYVNGSASATEFYKDFNGEGVAITGFGSTIEGCGFRGAGGNTGDGIVIKSGRVSLVDVAVFAMGQDGIRVGTDAGGENCNLFYLERIKSKNNGRDGVRISDLVGGASPNVNGGTFVHSDIQGNAACGVYLGAVALNTFVGVTIQTSGTYGVRFSSQARNNAWFGGDIEGSGTEEVLFDLGAANNFFQNSTVDFIRLTDNATARNRIELVDYTRLAASLTFGPGALTSPNPNALDYYQEGTFIPVLTFSTPGDLAVTYVANGQRGTYTRIGNRVSIDVVIETSAFTHTTASGELRITGLPFTAAGGTGHYGRAGCIYQGYTSATNPVVIAQVPNGAAYVAFRASGSGVAIANLGTTVVASGGTPAFGFSMTYQVAT